MDVDYHGGWPLQIIAVDDEDSPDRVEFQAPTPPPCGFHNISPDMPSFSELCAAGENGWAANLGRAQPVLTTPSEPRTPKGI